MTKNFLKAGGAALTLALLTAGATAVQSRSAVEATIKQAEKDAAAASAALTKRKPTVAIQFAERAVAARPQDATYRALLGKAYLAAGRFFSARQAFADALQLDGGQPGAALNYALATTATGDFAAAQQILTDNAGSISAADRGLALALAGNPAGGVEILIAAARSPDVNAKTRQNLALALALAGRWPEARQIALADLSPSDADARIVQWAAFARPAAASDQVAALLGVTPVADHGLPQQLALVSTAAVQVAEAAPETPAAAPQQVAASDWQPDTPAAAPTAEAPVQVAVVEAPAAPVAQIAFAERREVVQTLPAPSIGTVQFAERREVVQLVPARAAAPARVALVAAPAAKGNFYVQLGAFRGTDAARTAWTRAKVRHTALAGKTPSTMTAGKGLIRVSVGGFGRTDADKLCGSIKSGGGVCFVRANAGDRVASWSAGGNRFAAR